MKKLIALVLALACVFALASCGKSNSGDYPATIMVNGTNYYSTDNAVPVEVDESVIQYTTSYAENGIPQKDGEANFNKDLGTPYAVIEGDRVVVLIDNEWIDRYIRKIPFTGIAREHILLMNDGITVPGKIIVAAQAAIDGGDFFL